MNKISFFFALRFYRKYLCFLYKSDGFVVVSNRKRRWRTLTTLYRHLQQIHRRHPCRMMMKRTNLLKNFDDFCDFKKNFWVFLQLESAPPPPPLLLVLHENHVLNIYRRRQGNRF